jgi:amino acid permease
VFVKGHWSYQDFLFDYLSIVFFLVPWIGHMIWRRSFCPIPIDDIDVTTGSEEVEAQEQIPSPAANTVFGKLNAWLWG